MMAVTVSVGSAPSGVGPVGRFRECGTCGDLCQLVDGLLCAHVVAGDLCAGSGRLPRLTAGDRKESDRRRRVRVATGSSGVCPACGAEHSLLRDSLVFHMKGQELCAGSGKLPAWLIRPPRALPGAVLA